MSRKLVIVESPAKAKTVGRMLGSGYSVKASLGHVRDLTKWGLGVDTAHDFNPRYQVPKEKKAVVQELLQAVKKASSVYLATDPDREGEAIAWHLVHATAPNSVKRVVFHELNKEAVTQAFKHPRDIDMDLVYAQQARRILDRLVGYKLSPFLWRKVRKGLSAGRVQSVALRMVVDREREIEDFVAEEYWTIQARLEKLATKESFVATLIGLAGGKKLRSAVKRSRRDLSPSLSTPRTAWARCERRMCPANQRRPSPRALSSRRVGASCASAPNRRWPSPSNCTKGCPSAMRAR